MTLYYKKLDKEQIIARPKTIKKAFEEMNKYLNDIGYKSYYTRLWEENGRVKIDYGSHTCFFFLEGVTLKDIEKEGFDE